MRARDPSQAFALYVTGKSLRAVASELGIGRATIERWSQRESWVERRRQAWRAVAENAADRQAERLRTQHRLIGDQIYATFLDAISQHRAYVTGTLPRRGLRYGTRDLARLAEAVVTIGSREAALYETRSTDRG